jgi:hypothetical protein
VRKRLADLYALCSRLVPLTAQDAKRVGALIQLVSEDGRSIGELAVNGQLAKAYLLALRHASPAAYEGNFPNSPFAAIPGAATSALHD